MVKSPPVSRTQILAYPTACIRRVLVMLTPVSAIHSDLQRGPLVSDVVLSGSSRVLSVSSRDTCVPLVVAQVEGWDCTAT